MCVRACDERNAGEERNTKPNKRQCTTETYQNLALVRNWKLLIHLLLLLVVRLLLLLRLLRRLLLLRLLLLLLLLLRLLLLRGLTGWALLDCRNALCIVSIVNGWRWLEVDKLAVSTLVHFQRHALPVRRHELLLHLQLRGMEHTARECRG